MSAAATAPKITVRNNAREYRNQMFSRGLYDIEPDAPCTVTLTDGSKITGTFRDYTLPLSSTPPHVAVIKPGKRRATRIPFDQIRSVRGTKATSLAELLGAYIVQGDPAAGL